MLRKLISFSLAFVMLSVTAFAASAVPTFSEVVSDIEYVTETAKVAENNYLAQAKHEDVADLPTWDGTAAEGIIGGTGTADDPYLISNGGELAYFANAVNGKLTDDAGNAVAADKTLCAKLDRDINLAKEDGKKTNWEPFSMSGYKGTFDGRGHNIYNFYLKVNSAKGFFGSINSGGIVKNFNMIGVVAELGTESSAGTVNLGIICSYLQGEESTGKGEASVPTKLTMINNVYVQGTAGFWNGNSGKERVSIFGAIAGNMKLAEVRNCFSDVDINLVGNKATLSNNYSADCSIGGSSFGIGGVIGKIQHDKG